MSASRAPFTVRSGHIVIHCASAAALREALAVIRPPQSTELEFPASCKDNTIIAKLAVVNHGLLQVIADVCGNKFSGLGQADATIRRLVGSSWSRRAAVGFVTSCLRPDPTSPPVWISLRSVCMR